jgi:hypothetical protein
MPSRVGPNQENHFEGKADPRRIGESALRPRSSRRSTRLIFLSHLLESGPLPLGEVAMSGQVVLYFDDQSDALRFALAAGSVMAGEAGKFTSDLVEGTERVTRIRLDAVNAGAPKKPNTGRVA